MGVHVYHSSEKNETATMFFPKEPSLVIIAAMAARSVR